MSHTRSELRGEEEELDPSGLKDTAFPGQSCCSKTTCILNLAKDGLLKNSERYIEDILGEKRAKCLV